MIYLDTSVVVPLVVAETTTSKALKWRESLTAIQQRELALSAWTATEYTSAIGMKVRNRELSPSQGEAAIETFEDAVLGKVRVLDVAAPEFRVAEDLLRQFALGLRAGDALHLAIAVRNRASAVVCLDRALAKAGISLGLPMQLL
jgi:uncharacterized protein